MPVREVRRSMTNIDGLYITGGRVEATGGTYGPGIGAVGATSLKNIVISGGDTTVIAKGDQTSDTPGIGVGKYPGVDVETTFEHVASSPDNGYQGYVQDGESMDNYTFMEGSPFKEETEIRVGKFYTAVYFGPFRDENTVEPLTNEQIGANNVISKTGGKEFTKEQLKKLQKSMPETSPGILFLWGRSALSMKSRSRRSIRQRRPGRPETIR